MSDHNIRTFAPTSVFKQRESSRFFYSKGSKIVVVGAGAFGGWSALYLLRKGYKVTLVDAWGPGNSRSSSGDETRVIRSTYGNNETYFNLNVRALELWKENEKAFSKKLFYNTGVLWFCYTQHNPIVDDSIPFAKGHKMEYIYLTPAEVKKKYPIVNTDDLHHAYLDPFGGYLKAREACQYVTKAFIQEGGEFIKDYVVPGKPDGHQLTHVLTEHGSVIKGDAFLFACGAWLGNIFPEVLKTVVTCTKQEVYYFGVPTSFATQFDNLPAWIDLDGKDYYYGIAGNSNRGFKIGVDKRGEAFDPSKGERILNAEILSAARKFLAHRFPNLHHAPLIENRVCPYENSRDGNFIFDTHPEIENIVFLGGGSGHGFKHGPALGELVANVFLSTVSIPEIFRYF